ncbi:MAG: nitrous oxide-stimulated promoter family protein [Chloroflexi bacterium]|nr:nitrous oxide-stimulated promoter family protein [Chloroflexota bacterium]
MPKLFDRLNIKKEKDIKTLSDFIFIFCRENHPGETKSIFPIKDGRLLKVLGNESPVLCSDCQKLLSHGIAKLLLCSLDPKPMCKKCETHCYAPGYREKIREVMKFSGLYLVKHGRLDLMAHYLF